jgi:ornithine carbamoyltransferase
MASTELRRLAKDFVSMRDLAPADLVALLDLAARLKAERVLRQRAPTAAALAGLHVATLFEKPSLRTRATFEIGVRELGGDILDLPAPFCDGVREPLPDIARNLERWADALVVRTYAQSKVTTLAESAPRLHVINALTDEEHPCQALADMLTVQGALGELPRSHNRVHRRRQQHRRPR